MLITMYSLEKFPNEVRSEFELPVWPYSNEEGDYEEFQKYMHELTVFRYADSDMEVDGRDVSMPLTNLLAKEEDIPFMAFVNSVYVDDDFVPIKWPAWQDKHNPLIQKLASNPITSDMLAWTNWNTPVEIIYYTNLSIQRRVLEEYLDEDLKHVGKCWKPDKPGMVKK